MGSRKCSSSSRRVRHIEKRQNETRRTETACSRCHAHKIKCSGTKPCTACLGKNESATCHFDIKDTNVPVSKSYLRKLQEDSAELARRNAVIRSRQHYDGDIEEPSVEHHRKYSNVDSDVSNPILDGVISGPPSSEPVFVGEGACTAFGDRLLYCVDQKFNYFSSNTIPHYMQDAVCNRLVDRHPQLPDRGQVTVLIGRALRFIGDDYHLCLRKQFFRQLDHAYALGRPQNLHWACQLYCLLAIGEMYSNCADTTADNGRVPGSVFFLQAVKLVQDSYEEPSIEQVHSLLLLSFYSNVLGRVKSGHVYGGIAMRLAIGLGLHRSQPGTSKMDPVQREHRRRVWWTLYLFDRLTASRLGYPLAIQDNDIDIEMPSMNGLSEEEKEEFAEPQHLSANVNLARIIGKILNDINCFPRRHRTPFIQRVHHTLNELDNWDAELPQHLNIQQEGSPRGICSLHMLYNLCIIQTTRPILLHIFKSKLAIGKGKAPGEPPTFSPIALKLAESCVRAARRLNAILTKLFVAGTLAVFGYFDTHYLFSSTLILIISAEHEPAAATTDAIHTAIYLLQSMSKSGNVAASDYLRRLEHIRATVTGASALTPEGSGQVYTQPPQAQDDCLLPAMTDQETLPSNLEADGMQTQEQLPYLQLPTQAGPSRPPWVAADGFGDPNWNALGSEYEGWDSLGNVREFLANKSIEPSQLPMPEEQYADGFFQIEAWEGFPPMGIWQ